MSNEEKLREYLKRAMAETRRTQQLLQQAEDREREPIAIVGMGCRLPGGVASPEQFWQLLADGREGMGPIPTDRGWDLAEVFGPETPDRPWPAGAFVDEVSGFDAGFFGISPREALAMDPQQRILLEASWEALEDAGLDPETLRGGPVGAFIGTNGRDYASQLRQAPAEAEGYLMTGNAVSVLSGRLSYVYGFVGPALSVDTACSSSLVALHLACHSLRHEECDLALAGGVTVMSTPFTYAEFTKQGGLATDGRCKAYAGAADGTGWGEGAGVLVLERLSDARRRGHRVLGLLRGSSVNQDGASNGLTAPNGPSQERVILQALANAGVPAGSVDLIEGHGTGTRLGDPIEAHALLATYGQGRGEGPAWLGSVKSNIGHTQAAAGVAGVMKAVLAMRHAAMPVTLHVDEASPQVDWSAGEVELLTRAREWPRVEGRPRRAGVSSFGISGTNAHIIVEEGDPEPVAEVLPVPTGGVAWPLSAKSEAALRAQASRLADWVVAAAVGGGTALAEAGVVAVGGGVEAAGAGVVAGGSAEPVEAGAVAIGGTEPAGAGAVAVGGGVVGAGVLAFGGGAEAARPGVASADTGLVEVGLALAGRSRFPYRAAVVGSDRDSLVERLRVIAGGAVSAPAVGSVAVLFSGQGSQRVGMGLGLRGVLPVFTQVFDEVREQLGLPIDALSDAEALNRTEVTQPALFAVQVAAFRQLEAWGLRVSWLGGHSIGELSAAYLAGVWDLEGACKIVAARGRLMGQARAGGAMAAVEATEAQVLEDLPEGVGIAAVNGPTSVVVSGDADAVERLVERYQDSGHRVRRLTVSHAFHSHHMDSALVEFEKVVASVPASLPRLKTVSTLTGVELGEEAVDPGYWVRQVREPVRFADAVTFLADEGAGVFVDVSPDGVLTSMISDVVGGAAVVPTLRKDIDEPTALTNAAAALHTAGQDIDWLAILGGGGEQVRVALPTYAFEHTRYWLDDPADGTTLGDMRAAGLDTAGHPLLGASLGLAGGGWILTGRLSAAAQPWLADHVVAGVVTVPEAVLVELAVRGADEAGCAVVSSLRFEEPLLLPTDGTLQIQVTVGEPNGDGTCEVGIFSRADSEIADAEWTRHATGTVGPGEPADAFGELTTWPPQDAETESADAVYDRLADSGVVHGPGFRVLRQLWRSADDLFVELEQLEHLEHSSGQDGTDLLGAFAIHPALVDGLVQALAGEAAGPHIAAGISGFRLSAGGARRLRAQLHLDRGAATPTARVTAVDDRGEPVLSIDALTVRAVDVKELRQLEKSRDQILDALFSLDWNPIPATTATRPWTLIGEDHFGIGSTGDCTSDDAEAWSVYCVDGSVSQNVDSEDPGVRARAVAGRVLDVVRDWCADEARDERSRLVVLTRDAVAARTADQVRDLPAAAAWGLVRSAQSEYPGRVVLLDWEEGAASDLGRVLAGMGDEPQAALRSGRLLAPRLVRAMPGVSPKDKQTSDSPAWTPDSTVLITGGTGGIGAMVARHLAVRHGVRGLILVSRSGPAAPAAQALVDELADVGARVRVLSADVTDRASLAAALAAPGAVDPDLPLRGVVHIAGVIDDGMLEAQNQGRLDAVMRVKTDALWHLHDLTADLPLTAFVVFSAAAGIFGSPGQSNYAAGNTFADAFAAWRAAQGLPGVSMAWGLWGPESGMGARLSDVDLRRLLRTAVPLTETTGLALFDAACASGRPLLVPSWLNLAGLRSQLAGGPVPPLLSTLIAPRRRDAVTASPAAAPIPAPAAFATELAALDPAGRAAALLDLVRTHVGGVLGHASAASIPVDQPFTDLGFDSLTSVELRNNLARATGATLPATLVFDYPTPTALAGHLGERLGGGAARAVIVQAAAVADEPIAIIGMACRFPGEVSSPEDFWTLLAGRRDGMSPFPADRGWPPGEDFGPEWTGQHRAEGGFLADASAFDAAFFGISPREARVMDPQQRVLLEASWEALERVGVDPAALRGGQIGVFVGSNGQDYQSVLGQAPEESSGYLSTAVAGSLVSGRVAYALGLTGPAVTVDTACSSSLVALHLAAQALRNGECTMALAGGVTVMATPLLFAEFARQGGLAGDGRCKAYAGAADGTGWGEGVGVLAVERLSEARRQGHRVLGLLRGSAVNQDGASNGLTAPNGPSQERVILQALANAGLEASDVDLVEGHGTGTKLGDPIEAQALLATYGQDRTAGPVWLGSVKSNIGHTQAAAGVAGIIKTVLAMRHEVMPATLHVDEPSPAVDWTAGDLELLTAAREWPRDAARPRRAGVSAFGISGTNAHVIIEEGDPEPEPVPALPTPAGGIAWPLSAKSQGALKAQAAQLAEWAADWVSADGESAVAGAPDGDAAVVAAVPADSRGGGAGLVETGLALAARSHYAHRAVAVGADRAALIERLKQIADAGGAAPAAGPVAVLFSGQGSQRVGMGLGLRGGSPVFTEVFDEVCERLGLSVEVLSDAEALNRTEVTQPALFAVQVAAFRQLEAWGLSASWLGGHSIGELSAAYLAGVWDLEGACAIVAARGRLMGQARAGGAMAALEATEDQVLATLRGNVGIAAVNGPTSVVVSGDADVVDALVEQYKNSGYRARRLTVSHAFHSHHMDSALAEFEQVVASVPSSVPRLKLVSTLTGTELSEDATEPAYWVRQLREAVRFADAVQFLADQGADVFVDISPDGVLTSMISGVLDGRATIVPTLRNDVDEPTALTHTAAVLHTAGLDIDWSAVLGTEPDHPITVALPPYAFERSRFWLDGALGAGDVRAAGLGASDHPMLGAHVVLADGGRVLTGRLSLATHRWLADHVIGETVFVSGTGLVELAIRAGDEAGCTAVRELTLHAPLVIPAEGAVQIQVAVQARTGDTDDGERGISIHSRLDAASAAGGEWTLHAEGILSADRLNQISGRPAAADLSGGAEWPPPGAQPISTDAFYPAVAEHGYVYGPVYQGLRRAWCRGDELFVEAALPDGSTAADGFGVHPALLDAVLHGIALAEWDGPGLAGLPFAWTGVRLWASGAGLLRARLTQVREGGVRIVAVDGSGELVVEIDRLLMRPLPRLTAAAETSADLARQSLYTVDWTRIAATSPAPASGDADSDAWIVHRVEGAQPYGGPGAAEAASAETLRVVQQWVGEERDAAQRLVILTRGAVAAGTTPITDLAAASVWGLVRTAQIEHPGRVVLVDLDPEAEDTSLPDLAALGDEPQVAVREGQLYAPRLVRTGPSPTSVAPSWDPDGTVLITGGTAGLGALVARHLVAEHGVRSLVLLSRSGASAPNTHSLLAELTAQGARVRVVAGDVSHREVLADAIADIPARRPLRGVIHVAGVLDDGVLESLTDARLATVMRVKADAAWHLHELTADLPLSRFVLFSSAAGIFGNAGQANYTAGNAFLDALAAWRSSRGLPALSIGWGLWEEGVGMANRLSSTQVRRLAQAGMPITADQGLAMLDAATADAGAPSSPAHLVAANLDLAAIREQSAGLPVMPLLRALVPRSRRRAGAAAGGEAALGDALRQQLTGRTDQEQLRALLAIVRTQAAAVLGHASPDAVAPDIPFTDLGFDSLTSVELRNGLARATGLSLPATLVFDYPSPDAVAVYLRERVGGEAARPAILLKPARSTRTGIDEPIAIVGMACRYPGEVRTADEFWDLIAHGRDGIAPFPTDRGWELDAVFDPGAEITYLPEGGFVPGMAEFDAEFFGISPREALAMDPQQRLLLETTWEALEHAGIDPIALRGEQAGVFAGLMYHDYASRLPAIPENVLGFVDTGNAGSVLSGRIAYLFGLTGPAVTVDTACSSSLVALHLAVQALRTGECTMALAGGVAVMSTPGTFAGFARQGGLARNGRCKSYAGAADGTGWGEGVGMLVVERLSDARRLGHHVWGVVRGSAVNQDGASNGLTAPNGPSQERVILQALSNAGLAASDVDLIEGHGTGTTLGDPIEARALLATYGQGRDDDRPLWLGSVKSNIGHTQAAAGVAGVIKLVQALRHELMPPTLHVDQPSPNVDWSAGDVELLTEARAWPRDAARPRRAGVSSFGISGTNAHILVEEGDPEPAGVRALPVPSGGAVWPISAKSEAALRAQASRLARWAADGTEGLVETGLALAGRSRFTHRAVALGADRDALVAGLRSIALGEPRPGGAVVGSASPAVSGSEVLVFPGQGWARAGIGSELLAEGGVFAEAIEECGRALGQWSDFDLATVLSGPDQAWLERVDVVQPVLWAVMVGLARAWESLGVPPSVVIGHSQGEVAAAVVAGALTVEDGARVVATRSRVVREYLAGFGAMVSVAAPAADVEDWIAAAALTGDVSVAALNGPGAVVVSGLRDATLTFAQGIEARGDVRVRVLDIDYASHSSRVEMVRDVIWRELAGLRPRPVTPGRRWLSTVTGQWMAGDEADADYWYRNLREQVRFAPAVRSLVQDGHRLFVEASGHPMLTTGVEQILDAAGVTGVVGGTLRRDLAESAGLAASAARLFTAGVPIDWPRLLTGGSGSGVDAGVGRGVADTAGVFGSSGETSTGAGTALPGARIVLPSYAFEHSRYWLEAPPGMIADVSAAGLSATGHAVLGAAVPLPDGGCVLTGRLSVATQPWLADHAVSGTVLLPATAMLDLALRAGMEVDCDTLTELTLHAPVLIPETGALQLQVAVGTPDADGIREFAVHSRLEGSGTGEWTRHGSGTLGFGDEPADARAFADLGVAWPPHDAQPTPVDGLYEGLAEGGVFYGPSSQTLRQVWRRDQEIFAELELPDPLASQPAAFVLDPLLFGGALAALGLDEGAEPVMPFNWTDVRVWSGGARLLRVRLATGADGAMSIAAAGPSGEPVVTVRGLVMRPLAVAGLGGDAVRDALFELEWSAFEFPGGAGASAPDDGKTWAVVGDDPYGIAAGTQSQGFATLAEVPADVPLVLLCAGTNMNPDATAANADIPTRVRSSVTAVLESVREWLRSDDGETIARQLVVVTRGAVATSASDPVVDLAGAAVWGLVRSVQTEHPGRVLLLDLAPDALDVPDAATVSAAVAADEYQLAARVGGVLVPRMVRASDIAETGSGAGWDAEGTVLVTGATGGLGGVVVRHLAASGVRDLVLASRSGWGTGGSADLLAELSAAGVRVRLAACDVSQRADVAALLDGIAASGRPLSGVVHLAGATADSMVEGLTAEALDGALGAKVGGAWHLHELTAGLGVSKFVLFSSAAGVMGGAGMAGYAAGNAFLDGLISWRRAVRELPGISLAWGAWAEDGGMRGRLDDVDRRRLTRGGQALSNQEAVRLLDLAVDADRPLLLPIRLDLPRMRAELAGATAPSLLRTLVPATPNRRASGGGLALGTEALIAQLSGRSEQERRATLLALVRTHTAAVVGRASAADIPEDRAFSDLGFDSLISVEMRNALAAATGLRLPATLVFDYANPDALAGYLVGRFAELMSEGSGSSPARAFTPATTAGRGRIDEPIAIVGLACRFPGGAGSVDSYWELLAAGRDGLVDLPTDRGWEQLLSGAPGGGPDPDLDVRQGCFLDGAAGFDAGFFGISPREALAMDPQQRLLLETSWEALESAGIDPVALRGGDAGVFVGTNGQDYGALLAANPESAAGYVATGGASVMSGRVSYTLGLTGPAVTVDTACSSSLVALHWASQALRTGECSLALVGGVTVMATPAGFIEFSHQGGMSADGLCKAYAGAADGTGWGEGVGMLVVERLSDARRLGHQVWGVVRGSAVNQDGASNGLTAPNGPSQERVILQALANAGLGASDVELVEGHGTGTKLGDPIEAQALLATYGRDRPAGPAWLGSVKSNIGHTQAAAGVAGVIKAVMAMRHELMPATLHVDEPSPQVDWSAGEVEILTRAREWPRTEGRPRRAGVSSFGISGTNAHVILEEGDPAPVSGAPLPVPTGGTAWVVSAKSEGALRAQASRLAEWTADSDEGLVETALALATRSRFGHRAVAVGSNRAELVAGLRQIAESGGATGVRQGGGSDGSAGLAGLGQITGPARAAGVRQGGGPDASAGGRGLDGSAGSAGLGQVAGSDGSASVRHGGGLDGSAGSAGPGQVAGSAGAAGVLPGAVGVSAVGSGSLAGSFAVLFSGQGSQRVGMGLGLRGVLPEFTEVFDRVCGLLDLDLDVLSDAEALNRTEVTQPALFAVQVAAFRQLEAWGLSASWLGGHSIGELSAAYLAGVWSLEGACKIVSARGRLMGRARAGGAMAALEATETQVLADLPDGVGIAAVNGPTSIVVSGDAEAVDVLVGRYKHSGLRARRLTVSHAFHSHHMDSVLEEFEQIVASVPAATPRLKLVSTLTGTELRDEATDPAYWVRQVREAVRFGDAVSFLAEQGAAGFVDVSPDGVLTSMIAGALDEPATVIPTLRKDADEPVALLRAAAALYVSGVPIDWHGILAADSVAEAPGRVALPTYAFEHTRYWLGLPTAPGDVRAAGLGAAGHPLLSAVVPLAGDGGRVLTGRLSVATQPWLADHVIAGSVLVAGVAMVDLAIRAGDEAGCPLLKELTLHAPLVLPADGARQLQVTVSAPAEDGACEIAIHTRPESAGADASVDANAEWTRHATGMLTAAEGQDPDSSAFADLVVWPPEGARPVSVEGLYETLAASGFGYGPTFQGLRRVWRRDDELFVEAELPEDPNATVTDGFGVHPALLDSVIHALGVADGWQEHPGAGGLPFTWSDVRLHASGARMLRARLAKVADGGISLTAADAVGGPVIEVDRLVLRPLPEGALAAVGGPEADDPARDALFVLEWVPAAEPSAEALAELGEVAEAEQLAGWTIHRPTAVLAPRPDASADADAEAEADTDPADLAERVRAATAQTLEMVQQWAEAEGTSDTRLAIVTHGAVTADGESASDLAGSAIWGLVRSSQPELPGRLLLVDLEARAEPGAGAGDGAGAEDGADANADADLARALAVANASDEPQLAVRGGRVLAARLARAAAAGRLAPPTDSVTWRMEPGSHGTLDGLRLVDDPAAAEPLAPHEVRIEVRAAGLNFRDVLIALGMYPGRAELGSEGAGVVVEVGSDVSTLHVGDRVMGLFGGAFGPVARADHRMVARVPHGWSDETAASVPIVFLTAYYGLVELADLQAGERVLIHAAAGGVGMAAVQVAQHLGARVLATASSGKWDAVRALGVDSEAIASSRDLGFEEKFRTATAGEGVDVVLNALAGDFIDATLRLMPRGGRLVEMGKLDLRDPEVLALEHPGVVYSPFDLMDAGPERIGGMLAELVELFDAGRLRPLPVRGWDLRRAREAFQYVSQAKHIGKVVLNVATRWNREGTVLITGGTGGIGARLARHVVTEYGVHHLVLLARSGPTSEAAVRLVAELAELGARARVVAGDVADPAGVAAALAAVPADRPLTAVVHAAGVLDDGVLSALTRERLDRVMRPKADGAWNLHLATRDLPLAAFVLFSSAAGVLGSPGQANYSAGNAFLDGLAGWRRAQGLPAVSCAWGLWAGADGMGGRVAEGKSRSGGGLSTSEGLALFDACDRSDEPVLLPIRIDLAAMAADAADPEQVPAALRALVTPGRTRRTARHATSAGADGKPAWLADLPLRGAAEQRRLLVDLVRAQAAGVLRHASADEVDADRAFTEVGFDSLTAVELRNGIGAATGLRLPATVVFDHPTPRALAERLLTELVGDDSLGAAALLAELDRMEAALAAVAATDAEGGQILVRLQALAMKWTALRDGRAADTDAAGFRTATDDELFDFIDRDLGLS